MSRTEALSFADAHAAWHRNVEEQRTAPYGPLSPTALHWLSAEVRELPDLPGLWSADPDGHVTVWFVSGDRVTKNGAPAFGTVELGPLTGIASETLEWGDIRIEVAARSGRIAVRPRDPRSRDRADYSGTAVFPADPAWVVTGRFVPEPRVDVEVDSAVDGATQFYDSPGFAEFELGGRTCRLTLFGDAEAPTLRATFADASGGDLTFPAARSVQVIRSEDDTVIIDFNRTTNPPCAYSTSATCPFPPPENRLPVRIEAGELRPDLPGPPSSAA